MKKLLCGAFALALLALILVAWIAAPASAMGVTSWLSSPAATTAAKNAASIAASVACIIDEAAGVAVDTENAINSGKAKLIVRSGATVTVQVASAALCNDLHGIALEATGPAK